MRREDLPQQAWLFRPQVRRASKTAIYPPANPHHVGTNAGIHPEDAPSSSPGFEEEDADDSYYETRLPTSARRYQTTEGTQVIQRGNKRLVIHPGPPPRPKRRPHWLLISGLSMLFLMFLWTGVSYVGTWWTQSQLNATYEFPRVFQTDAVVYPGDSADHPSHYLFLNLQGKVLIIELPHGDSEKARIYKGPTLFSDNAASIPIIGEFRVVNGKIEMLVHIQKQTIVYVNNGTQFIPQQ